LKACRDPVSEAFPEPVTERGGEKAKCLLIVYCFYTFPCEAYMGYLETFLASAGYAIEIVGYYYDSH